MQGPPPELRRGRGLSRKRAGDRGEELALRYLQRRGYSLVARNYRRRGGEIDLILRQDETLVFVEVKLRRGIGFGDPVESVTPRKQARIRAVAEQYLAEEEPEFSEARFDVVGILSDDNRPSRIQHIQDAF